MTKCEMEKIKCETEKIKRVMEKIKCVMKKRKIKRDTDYLPDDIRAPPAFGTIESIVLTAVFTDCDSLQLVKGYPRARGNASQLTFRDHPVLGTVAEFSQFPLESTYPR